MKKSSTEKLITIDQTLDKIYSLVDYSMTHADQVDPAVFSLEKIRGLLMRLGDPQNDYPCIHIAGTKGKGSTAAMIAAGLRGAGYKVGLYTSPHLSVFNERICINGEMISDEELIQFTEMALAENDDDHPVSTFELTTAIAFLYFSRKKVEVAVIETGLGGRLDATNVLIPMFSVITSISLDHMSFLGNTITEIATEKAGIIKAGVPVICAPQCAEAKRVIQCTAAERGSDFIDVSMLSYEIQNDSPVGQDLLVRLPGGKEPQHLHVPLAGHHQAENALTAFMTLIKIKSYWHRMNVCDIINGLGRTKWPCRFEIINYSPIVIVDGAHNVDSMEKLMNTLDQYYADKKKTCIFGASADKKCSEMIRIIAPHVQDFILTRSTHPRAADPQILLKLAEETGLPCHATDTVEAALPMIWQAEATHIFIVTGSLFTAAGFREIL